MPTRVERLPPVGYVLKRRHDANRTWSGRLHRRSPNEGTMAPGPNKNRRRAGNLRQSERSDARCDTLSRLAEESLDGGGADTSALVQKTPELMTKRANGA